MAKVIPIWEDETYYATCPECGGHEWLLPVNGVGMDWDALKGSECAGCGFLVTWLFVDKEDGGGEECNDG